MGILSFIIICYGASNNMVYGSIFEGWRQFLSKFGTGGYSLYKLFTCMMCLPTWMGFAIYGLLRLSNSSTPLEVNGFFLPMLLHGLLATGGSWLLHTLQEHLEK